LEKAKARPLPNAQKKKEFPEHYPGEIQIIRADLLSVPENKALFSISFPFW
jgi:hypothetical protein